MERETGRIPAEAEPGWILRELERLKALLDRDTQRAKIEIAKHLDGDLVVKPLGGERGERRAEIKVRVKPDGLLGFQEAVDLVYAPKWLRGLDLNQRPLGYEPNELPGCSTPR